MFGPSGAGKTYSALRMATGLGGKIALIDTERGSASKYSDRFAFDVVDLDEPTISNYTSAINLANESNYNVLIIDSLSHAWQQLLEKVEQLAQKKYKGNSWSAWSEGTPVQRNFVKAILGFKGHVIATMRSKTEWVTEKDGDSGKSRPVRIGLAPEQGKGIEYEFDILLELNQENAATVIKDRTGKFQGKFIEQIGEPFGKELVAWLSEGAAPQVPAGTIPNPSRPSPDFGTDVPHGDNEAPPPTDDDAPPKVGEKISAPQIMRLHAIAKENGHDKARCQEILKRFGYSSSKDVLKTEYDKIVAELSIPF
jgi:hypothetical protein